MQLFFVEPRISLHCLFNNCNFFVEPKISLNCLFNNPSTLVTVCKCISCDMLPQKIIQLYKTTVMSAYNWNTNAGNGKLCHINYRHINTLAKIEHTDNIFYSIFKIYKCAKYYTQSKSWEFETKIFDLLNYISDFKAPYKTQSKMLLCAVCIKHMWT